MKFAHLKDEDPGFAAVDGDRVLPLSGVIEQTNLDELVSAGSHAWSEAEKAISSRFLADDTRPLSEVSLGVPLRRPSKIVCIGLNYADHVRETGMSKPAEPLLFAKFGTSICGTEDSIRWPLGLTECVDWEAELAVVVGRTMKDVPRAHALDYVFGYTAANDISARDLQSRDGQWVRSKSLDGFCPLGPVVTTKAAFGDPGTKRIECRVNDRVKQRSNTAEMIFDTAEILSFVSRNFTLLAGDVVLTGTPWGAGGFADPPAYLNSGDVVEVEVEGIGVLRNLIVGPTPSASG